MAKDRRITIKVSKADIPLRQVPGIVAKIFGGDPVSRQAVYQWTTEGRRASDGSTVMLKTETKRGQKHTTLAWIKKFVEAL